MKTNEELEREIEGLHRPAICEDPKGDGITGDDVEDAMDMTDYAYERGVERGIYPKEGE